MSSRWYLTQIRVDSARDYSRDNEGIKLSESEFTSLLRKHWSHTPDPRPFPDNNWSYQLVKSPDDIGYGDVSLLNDEMVSGRLSPIRWILLTIIVQRYLKRPLYMWNDSNLEHFLEITDTTTERDILLFFDNL